MAVFLTAHRGSTCYRAGLSCYCLSWCPPSTAHPTNTIYRDVVVTYMSVSWRTKWLSLTLYETTDADRQIYISLFRRQQKVTFNGTQQGSTSHKQDHILCRESFYLDSNENHDLNDMAGYIQYFSYCQQIPLKCINRRTVFTILDDLPSSTMPIWSYWRCKSLNWSPFNTNNNNFLKQLSFFSNLSVILAECDSNRGKQHIC